METGHKERTMLRDPLPLSPAELPPAQGLYDPAFERARHRDQRSGELDRLATEDRRVTGITAGGTSITQYGVSFQERGF